MKSLRTRVLAVLALASIVPTVLVGFLAIRRARADLENEVVRGHLALIHALGGSLDGTLQAARRTLDLAAAAWADGPREAAATERLLRRLRRDAPLLAAVAILDVDGRLLAGDPAAAAEAPAKHTFGGYIGDITFTSGRPAIAVVAQARSRTGEQVGTFAARLDLVFIADALAEARLGPGARLLVVDGEGVPVARSDGQPVAGAASLRGASAAVDRALTSPSEGSLEAGGVVAVYRNLSSYQSLRGVRWAIVLEQPARDAYALARKTTRDTLLAGALVLALALAAGALLAGRLTRPLVALAARADAIAGGEVVPPAYPRGPGEIGALGERLDEMARRLGERERLQGALARGDRLAAVGTMAASVAHEVNNPLTTVLGYAKLLLEDKPDDHPDRSGLALIADEAARMQHIVRGLLDYSRADVAGRDERLDLEALLDRTEALLGPALRTQKIAVARQRGGGLPAVHADPHALQQVFVNLAQNAAHAMAGGGTLTIRTEAGAGGVAVAVNFLDTGPGVPAAARERIFDPFYTTKQAGSGTGLGLAVAKHLVTKLGGAIAVADNPAGRGACFRVTIPVDQ